MSSCPFCQGEIADDLERFGGPCPHCFNEIPGEEAATDPGVAAQAAEKQAQQLQAKKRGMRTVLIGGVALLVLAGGGGWFGYQEHLKQQQIAALLAWEDTAVAEFTFVTTEELEAMEAEIQALEEAALEDEKKAAELEARKAAYAAKQAEKAAQDQELAQFDDKWANADAGEAAPTTTKSTMGGPTGGMSTLSPNIGISGGGPDVDVVRKGQTMKGDAQIRKMVDQYVGRQSGAIQFCYQQAMNKNAGLGGAWHLTFRLNKDGTLSNVKFTATGSNADATFENCVVRRVQKWQMNETDSPLDYKKKFAFKAGF